MCSPKFYIINPPSPFCQKEYLMWGLLGEGFDLVPDLGTFFQGFDPILGDKEGNHCLTIMMRTESEIFFMTIPLNGFW